MPDLRAVVATRDARQWSDAAIDVVVAGLLVMLAAFGTGPATQNQGLDPAPAAAVALAVLAGLACVGWRLVPLLTFPAVSVLTMAYLAAGFAFGPILVAQVVATYGMASRLPMRSTLRWSGVLAVVLVAVIVSRTQLADVGEWLDYVRVAAWLVVPLAVGSAVRVRRRATIEVRDAHLRQVASEERLRMAQDLHDVVGHGLAVIAMQAGVAMHVLDRDPAKARESLEAIRATSREALDGLRGELAALTGGEPSVDAAPRRPTPALADLDVLVDRVRAGGIRVETEVTVPDGLPAAVEGVAFRIVQESLTNVLRHAGADTAHVRVTADTTTMVVDVVDDGTETPPTGGSPDTGGGTGIAGMRSRAASVGGTLSAGPRPAGGFAVHAELPLDSAPPAGGTATSVPKSSEGGTAT